MSVEQELMLFCVLGIVIGIMLLYWGLGTANEFEYTARRMKEWAKEELDKRKQMEDMVAEDDFCSYAERKKENG